MSLQRLHCEDRASWLKCREIQGIGASEVAAIVGYSPWMTASELWEIKTGRRQRKDLADNESVQRGTNMEGAIRDFFIALHGNEYKLEYFPFDILYQPERPHYFATLDGELTDLSGRKGIFEIKTASPSTKEQYKAWDGRVPDHYYLQLLGQFLATGYDFAILQAALWNRSGDITLKDPYYIERTDAEADLVWLAGEEDQFWHYVETDTNPGARLIF